MKLVRFDYDIFDHNCRVFELTEDQEILLRYIRDNGIDCDDIEIIDTDNVPKLNSYVAEKF